MVDQKNREIICVAAGKGRDHDFKLFKRCQLALAEEGEWLADRGYQGIQKMHKKSRTPKKKPRGGELSQSDRQANKELASQRIVVEHVIGKLKVSGFWRKSIATAGGGLVCG